MTFVDFPSVMWAVGFEGNSVTLYFRPTMKPHIISSREGLEAMVATGIVPANVITGSATAAYKFMLINAAAMLAVMCALEENANA